MSEQETIPQRLAIEVRGIVQGVGFRPFVRRLAVELRLTGWVRNESGSVPIEAQGEPDSLRRFPRTLSESPPPLVRVEEVRSRECPPLQETDFRILAGDTEVHGMILLSPDVAPCEDVCARCATRRSGAIAIPF